MQVDKWLTIDIIGVFPIHLFYKWMQVDIFWVEIGPARVSHVGRHDACRDRTGEGDEWRYAHDQKNQAAICSKSSGQTFPTPLRFQRQSARRISQRADCRARHAMTGDRFPLPK